MLTSQQISALIAAQQQQLAILQRALPSGQVPVPNMGVSQYPPSFSYGYAGPPAGAGGVAAMGGVLGAAPVALGAAQTGAAIASSFGVSNLATSILAPSFGGGLAGLAAGAAIPAAALAGTAYVAGAARQGLAGFAETQGTMSNYGFANINAARGRGFSTQDQLGMYRMMEQFQAKDPYTTMQDMQSMLRAFNDMKMGQGIRDAKEFADKFKKMSETVIDMARMMGTTLEDAARRFGEMRQAGFISGADLRRNAVDMMIAQGRGIDQGSFMAAQQQGAALTRSQGMMGRLGAQSVSGISSGVMGAMERGLTTEAGLMDVFGTANAGEASLQFGQEMTGNISNFLMSPQGQAFLAAAGERDASGKFTGKLSQQRLSQLTAGGVNAQDMLNQAAGAIQGTSESALSYANQKTSLANEFMRRDSKMKDVVDMMRRYAERTGRPGDDMTKLIIKRYLGVDTARAELAMKMAEDYEKEADSKLRQQVAELSAQEMQMRLKTGGTAEGIMTGIKGKISDFVESPIRAVTAGAAAKYQQFAQGVQDYIAGVDRNLAAAGPTGGAAMMSALASPTTLQSLGVSPAAVGRQRELGTIAIGKATPEMFVTGARTELNITQDQRRSIDRALANPDIKSQIDAAIRQSLVQGGSPNSKISTILHNNGIDPAKGDPVSYVLASSEEGKALLREGALKSSEPNAFFGSARPIEEALADQGLYKMAVPG